MSNMLLCKRGIRSASTLFAAACLSQYLSLLRYVYYRMVADAGSSIHNWQYYLLKADTCMVLKNDILKNEGVSLYCYR